MKVIIGTTLAVLLLVVLFLHGELSSTIQTVLILGGLLILLFVGLFFKVIYDSGKNFDKMNSTKIAMQNKNHNQSNMKKPPQDELVKFNVNYPQDTVFTANARLLQSQWRDKKEYPIGTYLNHKTKTKISCGNLLDENFAKEKKANFLTENIKNLVTQEVEKSKKTDALISEPRIWNNLLSSQPLCFNLFGELYFDLNLATKFFQDLFPERIDSVMAIRFEYSPGRKNPNYLNDRSAFDVFVEYTKDNKKGFIGIEVKYQESLREESKTKAEENFVKNGERYTYWTDKSNVFKPNSIEFLKQPPISQIWRDHLLCFATKQDYEEGFFVFLYPEKNSHCQEGVDNYKQFLMFDNEEQNCFYPRTLEMFFNTLANHSTADWVTELKQRYEV